MAITVPKPRLVDAAHYEGGINVSIASNDAASLTELLRIHIPSEPGQVRLTGRALVQAANSGQQTSVLVVIAPAGANILSVLDFDPLRNVGAAAGANSELYGRHTKSLERWLPPGSPGDYILAAVRMSGASAANMGGTTLAPASLVATREW